jgi:hypothetical protein
VNVIDTVQLAPGDKLGPQVLVLPKSPDVDMFANVSAVVPMLVKTTDCAVLLVPTNRGLKVSEFTETKNAAPTPVPLKVIVEGPVEAFEYMVSAPCLLPPPTGLNVTDTVHDAATVKAPQLFVCV